MSLPVTPRNEQYIIEKDQRPAERQAGSIIIVETSERAISSGVIRKAPPGAAMESGLRVYFSPYAGYTLVVDGSEYVQVADHEILGSFDAEAEVYVA